MKPTVGSNPTPSANITAEMIAASNKLYNATRLTAASNKLYNATRLTANWIVANPSLVSYWDDPDEFRPLKDLMDNAERHQRFRIRRGGRVRSL